MPTQRFIFLAALLAVVLSGCANLPTDSGRSDVAALLKARGHDVAVADNAGAVQRLSAELSGKPLMASDAVRLALVNNPQLKAEYAKLGFAAADVYDAGRLSNPTLSASALIPNVSGEATQVGFGLVQSFTNLLLLPSRSRFAEGEFERVKQMVGAQTLNLAADTEASYYRLVGTWQLVRMREAVAKAAQSSADLAQRFFDAGNINRLELALEQAAASQAQLDVMKAQAEVTLARGELNRLMGLAATKDDWKVSAQLPAPLADEDALPELLKVADSNRLDLEAARKRVLLFTDAQGMARKTRFLGEIGLGVQTERETDGSRITGPTLSLELPIFNQGRGRIARADAGLQEAEAELRSLEIGISNGVQRASAEVAVAKTRAEHYRQSLIPLREAIVARTQEEVNFMLKGQFELLLVKQQEYDAYQGYLEAVRDYWLARVELTRQVGAPLPRSAHMGEATLDAETLIQPKEVMRMEGMKGMGGMEEMNSPGHDMNDMKGMDMPMETPGQKMDGKGMPGMKNMKDKDMDMKGMEGMEGMEGMKQEAPDDNAAAKKAACDQLKNAAPDDPLTQALDMKCREQKKPAASSQKAPSSNHHH